MQKFLSLKFLSSITWVCNYIGIRKPEFVTKTHEFLFYCIDIALILY